jgi:hypothetical protein
MNATGKSPDHVPPDFPELASRNSCARLLIHE